MSDYEKLKRERLNKEMDLKDILPSSNKKGELKNDTAKGHLMTALDGLVKELGKRKIRYQKRINEIESIDPLSAAIDNHFAAMDELSYCIKAIKKVMEGSQNEVD
jgi:hypothetical protein